MMLVLGWNHHFPDSKVHGANMGPRWAPCWPHKPCCQGDRVSDNPEMRRMFRLEYISYSPCFSVRVLISFSTSNIHDDVIKWKHFPRYWPFVRGIQRCPVNSPHKGQWHGALMFTLICARINGWVNTCEASDLRRHRPHYDVILM